MVALYVGGEKVGTLADLERLLPELSAKRQAAELRDDTGNRLCTIAPEPPPLAPGEPLVPWDPTITLEELNRRAAEPGFTIEEVRKRLGWA
ncbi:MAG: hypothetical protein K8U57_08135 [Planctomycetes bacterium]|nr:hypothetical protein [Planctomycetota bacterium]